jgi:hypothetical protein
VPVITGTCITQKTVAIARCRRRSDIRLVMPRASTGRCGEVVVDQPQYSVSGIRFIRALTYLAMRQS